MKTRTYLCLILSAAFALSAFHLSADDTQPSAPIVIATPSAPHPQFRLVRLELDLQAGTGVISGDWLDAQGQPVDTGNSIIRLEQLSAAPLTESQQQLLAAAIAAATQ
jgi:hypothetical protein